MTILQGTVIQTGCTNVIGLWTHDVYKNVTKNFSSSSSLVLETESKKDNENFLPTFQLLTKSGGKALDLFHAQQVLHQ